MQSLLFSTDIRVKLKFENGYKIMSSMVSRVLHTLQFLSRHQTGFESKESFGSKESFAPFIGKHEDIIEI